MTTLTQWALQWGVPYAALRDLEMRFRMHAEAPPATDAPPGSEAAAQSRVRLEASRKGFTFWRNNVGAMHTADGQFVRFGLANDSEQMNKRIKSGDLIACRPTMIEPYMVGHTFGLFVSREIKRPGWTFTGTPREVAQQRWNEYIVGLGGDACFATGEGTL